MMPEFSKFILKGERTHKRTKSIVGFETTVLALDYDDAQRTARDNWRDAWENVRFDKVAMVQS